MKVAGAVKLKLRCTLEQEDWTQKGLNQMKQYKLPVVMYEPNEETENKYMAEIPILPGCRAWGSTPAETLEYLQSVATEFILSYKAHGHALPKAVEECAYELVGPKVKSEVTVVL